MRILRWICKNCNKKWIYPVHICVYCKGQIEKQIGTKIKVVGATNVSIPSPMHPIIPYNVILLQDEFGNRIPKKTMKEYKIGDIFVQEKAKTNDAVSIVKVKYDVYEAINESLDLLNYNFSPEDMVLVKPSIIVASYPYQHAATSPEFADELLKSLLEKGVKKENVIVAEQALVGTDSMDATAKSGILGICKKHNIQFMDISKGPFEEIESDGMKFNISKQAIGRKIVNCPVMKTNFQIGISGAVENLSRLVDEKTQRDMYYNDIEITLPKLAAVLKDVINIADATSGMQGQGPLLAGEPAFLNLVYASRNAALLDSAFCQAAMLEIPNYVSKMTKSIGMEVVGNDIDSLKYPIKTPIRDETPHPDIKVIDGKACPACLNLMNNLTSKLVGLRGDLMHIVMGSALSKEDFEKERVIVLGDCAIRKAQELNLKPTAIIQEKLDSVEQLVLLKKLLTTKGTPQITPIDKVRSKMKKLLSRVVS